jgi:hypothetical protein
MRKATRRKKLVPVPPPGLRAKLDAPQLLAVDIAHHANLDTIARGGADANALWDLAGAVLTWHRVAEKIGTGIPEMTEQLHMATAVIERFKRTGKVGFSGTEYQVARAGADQMSALARVADEEVVIEAMAWMHVEINRIAAAALQEREPCSH